MRNALSITLVWIVILSLHFTVAGQGSAAWETHIKNGDQFAGHGLYEDAETAYREALALALKFSETDPRIAVNLIRLAGILNQEGKRLEAETYANRSLSALEKATTASAQPSDPAEAFYRTEVSVMILSKAAGILVSLRKYSEAEPAHKKIIALREESAGISSVPASNKDSSSYLSRTRAQAQVKLADAYERLAALYLIERKYEEAEPFYVKASKVLETEFGADSPQAAAGLSGLANLYTLQGKYERAEPLYTRAVGVFEKSGWLDKPEAALAFENYSSLLKRTGRETEAAVMLEKARAIRARIERNSN